MMNQELQTAYNEMMEQDVTAIAKNFRARIDFFIRTAAEKYSELYVSSTLGMEDGDDDEHDTKEKTKILYIAKFIETVNALR